MDTTENVLDLALTFRIIKDHGSYASGGAEFRVVDIELESGKPTIACIEKHEFDALKTKEPQEMITGMTTGAIFKWPLETLLNTPVKSCLMLQISPHDMVLPSHPDERNFIMWSWSQKLKNVYRYAA
jgi:hypothetical protein